MFTSDRKSRNKNFVGPLIRHCDSAGFSRSLSLLSATLDHQASDAAFCHSFARAFSRARLHRPRATDSDAPISRHLRAQFRSSRFIVRSPFPLAFPAVLVVTFCVSVETFTRSKVRVYGSRGSHTCESYDIQLSLTREVNRRHRLLPQRRIK